MTIFFDFFPILLFFLAFKLYGIYVATAVAIAASFAQVGYFWYKNRRFEAKHLVSLALIVVFGGAALLLHDEMFIKWKLSVLNWLLGLSFLGSQFFGRQTITERMMGSTIALPAIRWKRLNLSWAAYFIGLGFLNLYIIYHFDTNTWVNFKLFGTLGLTLAFVLIQAVYLSRHGTPVNSTDGEP